MPFPPPPTPTLKSLRLRLLALHRLANPCIKNIVTFSSSHRQRIKTEEEDGGNEEARGRRWRKRRSHSQPQNRRNEDREDNRKKKKPQPIVNLTCFDLAHTILEGHEGKFSIYAHALKEKPVHVSRYFAGRDIHSEPVRDMLWICKSHK
ncbi:hypothetical protein RIF29_26279 [Crotalaria pallida]|uniref:Uncharacterized protein n=1 Tax=Crotalaria pallida TaxID=3830 RepID=A0AAN9I096_CROPI